MHWYVFLFFFTVPAIIMPEYNYWFFLNYQLDMVYGKRYSFISADMSRTISFRCRGETEWQMV